MNSEKQITPKPLPASREEQQLSFWENAAPEPPQAKKRSKRLATKLFAKINPELSSVVGREIIEGKLKPATWALALAYSDGSHDQAITHYARLRLEALAEASDFTKTKEQALETRRKLNFRKVSNPPPRPYSGNLAPTRSRNRRRIRLSPTWLAGLWISATAACVAGGRHFSETGVFNQLGIGITGSFGIGAILVGFIAILHLSIPQIRFVLRLFVPVSAWAATSAAFYCGLMILENSRISPKSIALHIPIEQEADQREIAKKRSSFPQEPLPATRPTSRSLARSK